MAQEKKTLITKLLQGTDLSVVVRPSYIRIAGPVSTVAYGHYRADGSIRLQIRNADGTYPEKLIVDDDSDLPLAREKLLQAEGELAKVAGSSVR